MKNMLMFILVCFLLAGCAHGTVPASSPKAPRLAAPPTGEQGGTLARKRIGLVAHDARKPELLAWVASHAPLLAEQSIFCTGTTGRLVAATLQKALPGQALQITRFNSGPLGGDQQMGALIAENGLDILIFFIDPMTAHPHAADIQALLRLSRLCNIVVATTPATADYVIASPLFRAPYRPYKPDSSSYVNRKLP